MRLSPWAALKVSRQERGSASLCLQDVGPRPQQVLDGAGVVDRWSVRQGDHARRALTASGDAYLSLESAKRKVVLVTPLQGRGL